MQCRWFNTLLFWGFLFQGLLFLEQPCLVSKESIRLIRHCELQEGLSGWINAVEAYYAQIMCDMKAAGVLKQENFVSVVLWLIWPHLKHIQQPEQHQQHQQLWQQLRLWKSQWNGGLTQLEQFVSNRHDVHIFQIQCDTLGGYNHLWCTLWINIREFLRFRSGNRGYQRVDLMPTGVAVLWSTPGKTAISCISKDKWNRMLNNMQMLLCRNVRTFWWT